MSLQRHNKRYVVSVAFNYLSHLPVPGLQIDSPAPLKILLVQYSPSSVSCDDVHVGHICMMMSGKGMNPIRGHLVMMDELDLHRVLDVRGSSLASQFTDIQNFSTFYSFVVFEITVQLVSIYK